MNAKKKDDDGELQKKGTWLGFFLKFFFFLSAFVLIVLTVMANMGGNSDTLKESIELYVAELTGKRAVIERLNRMTFFPNISFNFDNLGIYEWDFDLVRQAREMDMPIPPPSGEPLATLEHAELKTGFFDVMFGSGNVKELSVRNLSISRGFVFDKPVIVESVSLRKENIDKALMEIDGKIGSDDIGAKMDMVNVGNKFYPEYSFAQTRSFSLVIGDVDVKGNMTTQDGFVEINPISFSLDKKEVLTGDLRVQRLNEEEIGIRGRLQTEGSRTVLEPDIIFTYNDGLTLNGGVHSESLDVLSFSKDSPIMRLLNHIENIFMSETSEGLDVRFKKMRIELEIDSLLKGQDSLGRYEGSLENTDDLNASEVGNIKFNPKIPH